MHRNAFRSLGAAAVIAATAVVSAPASADTYMVGSCGSGYSVVEAMPLSSDIAPATGSGVIFLYYNSSNGKNCAILRRDVDFIASGGMGITLRVSDGQVATDASSSYRSYAGPVYLYGRGHCVSVDAWVRGFWKDSGYLSHTDTGGIDWSHCG
ncbi:spore-associated protein A [Microbispora sp. NPDC049125]|uniref:spore-associated protein A n=1 Tax=Microbispora sp. NPDC049125 TaxID=3154929 RepID=UPI0034661407